MEKLLKILLTLLIFGLLLASLTYYIEPSMYRTLIREDGPIEYLTAFSLLLGAIALAVRLLKVRCTRGRLWFWFNLLMILGLFFGFGEEISWGQRLFSIPSGEFFIENNAQGETNLHNLVVHDVKLNKLIFSYGFSIVFGFYFLLLLGLYKKSTWIKNTVDRFGVPIPTLQHTLGFLVTSGVIFLIPDGKKWELWEGLFGLFFLLILIAPYNTREKLLLTEETETQDPSKRQAHSQQ